MKRIGKIGFAALLVTGLGVQAYAVSVGSSPMKLLDATPVSSSTEVEATQLVFSLDEIEPQAEMEPAPSSVLEVGSIADSATEGVTEQLTQNSSGNIISDTVISESYQSVPTTASAPAGYAPATYSSGGGFASSGGGGFGGAGAGGLAGGSSALGLGLIGAAVAIPVAVSSDDDDEVVAYPVP